MAILGHAIGAVDRHHILRAAGKHHHRVALGAQYRRALDMYLEGMDQVIRETEVDYHRIGMHEKYDDVLARFLLGRTPKRRG